MAQQQQKATKQQDPYVSRGKTLASSVQRLRGWVGSDPSRTGELADALVELTAHRLFGHAYAAAGPDAQDAVQHAAQLLTANGPIGPYTSTGDAVRYVTAVVHLAGVQVGMGLSEPAGRSMASLHDVRAQLDEVGIELRLEPATAVWALLAEGRSALAVGDIGRANADADAALARWAESPLHDDPQATYVALDVERLASDARWAAGLRQEALGYLLSAKDRYDASAVDRLGEPGRLGQPVLERLAEPLSGLYSATADRLIACGETDLGSKVRRDLIELLRTIEKRWGEPARRELEAAEAALSDARGEQTALDEAPISWPSLSVDESYASTTAQPDRSVDPRALDADRRHFAAAWLVSHRDEAKRQEEERRAAALAEAERRREAEQAAEEAEAQRKAAERAEAEQAARHEADRAAAVEEAERQERKRRREERLEAHRLEVERREAEQREAEQRERERREAEVRATDPAEADRLELERLQAELAELERAEAERAERERLAAEQTERERQAAAERAEQERLAAEQAEQERLAAERAERERLAAERAERARLAAEQAEQERLAAERAEQERLAAERAERERQAAAEQAEQERLAAEQAEQERLAAEQAEQERREELRQAAEREELALAVRQWQEAKAAGGRRAVRAANERVVELLRPRADADLTTYGPQLREALEELSRARLRVGDVLGSRAPAREAKALADRMR